MVDFLQQSRAIFARAVVTAKLSANISELRHRRAGGFRSFVHEPFRERCGASLARVANKKSPLVRQRRAHHFILTKSITDLIKRVQGNIPCPTKIHCTASGGNIAAPLAIGIELQKKSGGVC